MHWMCYNVWIWDRNVVKSNLSNLFSLIVDGQVYLNVDKMFLNLLTSKTCLLSFSSFCVEFECFDPNLIDINYFLSSLSGNKDQDNT